MQKLEWLADRFIRAWNTIDRVAGYLGIVLATFVTFYVGSRFVFELWLGWW